MKKFKDAEFKTSSHSNVDPIPYCVEVARASDGTVAVKHSQDPDLTNALVFNKEEWIAFVKGVKSGEFDV